MKKMKREELAEEWAYRMGVDLMLWPLGASDKVVFNNANYLALRKNLLKFYYEAVDDYMNDDYPAE